MSKALYNKTTVFQNARIVDPSRNMDEIGALIVDNGVFMASGKEAHNQGVPEGAEVYDLEGKTILPGLVDSRVFVGEPGEEHRETIESASHSAAAGGITSFLMMPDTNPVIDSVSLVEFIKRTARETAKVHVHPVPAITKGLMGQELTEFGLMKNAGAIAFSDGKKTIENSAMMRRAMTYARDFDMPIMHETQDKWLNSLGVMNEGLLASWLGLLGIPKEAEIIPLERDLRLANLTQCRYHAAQISTAMSAETIERAKQKNTKISSAVSINHISLNENDIGEYRTFFRLSPPLRTEDDRLSMIESLRNGTIDMIVSSHDPQDVDTKRLPFEDSQTGAVGLETLLAAALRLYHNGSLSLITIVRLLSTNPAKLFGLDAGTLKQGQNADFIIVDLEEPWVLSLDMLHSRSKNSPFEKARFQGRVLQTYVKGLKVFSIC
ncbi:dihydroorotase [Bartonella tamiae]|uniref:Dihydroorotase, multifunctional complex type n=1 Tax=Bartonella tamiae Th239 TaxID=1094558 RepID=J0QSB1_9HYPH|nr:dihydroorotase [Bartonella tamiae]EJF88756.1 dihydroorotase, multifunctional complex type [Bartonella tamiae Th239]EJF94994.1 dihydroorotase, multifunctional complex type [Bartonella tamiae Th307]